MNKGEDVKELMKTGKLPTDTDENTQEKAWERVFNFLDKHVV